MKKRETDQSLSRVRSGGSWTSSQPEAVSQEDVAGRVWQDMAETLESLDKGDVQLSTDDKETDIDDELWASDAKTAKLFRRIKFEVEPEIRPSIISPDQASLQQPEDTPHQSSLQEPQDTLNQPPFQRPQDTPFRSSLLVEKPQPLTKAPSDSFRILGWTPYDSDWFPHECGHFFIPARICIGKPSDIIIL
ncbi:hypothetical protein BKA70DRAFT_599214 [Coprinopsis sp. MPI-PUGE-AT-0042]|nr:hypothetical protein BKA70DRAFT_599214 [Coprinopsis sp. MPI-PUGE-AT-0042]